MQIFLVFGVISIVPGLFFLLLAIQSKRPDNLVLTTGKLTKAKRYKDYPLKRGTAPRATECTYTYMVDGKSYQLRGVKFLHSRNIRKCVPIVYLRNFPRCAYEEHFSGIKEWLAAFAFISVGIMYFIVYITVI